VQDIVLLCESWKILRYFWSTKKWCSHLR